MGELLCISEEASMGQPRFPAWTDAADLRVRSSCNSHQYDLSEREPVAYFPPWNAFRNSTGIHYWRCDGTSLSCQILGL